MSQIYDNWDRLVRFTLRREQLRLIALRTPSASPSPSPSRSGSSPSTASSSPPSPSKIPSLLIGEAFDYHQILLASNYFSDSNFIRRGRSGELFYGVLDDGTRVVIKKMDYSSPYCVSELQALGKDSSRTSLVPLLGHCSDGFLIYKYMSMGDLSSSFFRRQTDPHDENSSLVVSLDWIWRWKIAIGAAEALCYLHHYCFPPLVHRDIQASSIFLDDNYQVRLGSLGDVCIQRNEEKEEEEKKAKKQINFTRFQVPKKSSVQGTSGNNYKPATCAYDIYCFGKVMLELVTGNVGISASDCDAAMDQDWLQQLLPYICPYDRELVVKIVEPSLIVDEDLLENVWTMANVAKSCLNPDPSRRPLMRDVLKALQNPLEVANEAGAFTAFSSRELDMLGFGSPICRHSYFSKWGPYQ